MYRQYWAIRIGPKSTGYIVDKQVFDTKAEAQTYKTIHCPDAWSDDWHVIKITEGENQ